MKNSEPKRDNTFKVVLSAVLLAALVISIFVSPQLGITSSVGIIAIWLVIAAVTFAVIFLVLRLLYRRK